MKKVLLFIAILFFFDRFGQAQSLTIEYNIGHGSYQMSDMKDILKNQMLPVTNAQVTDNFPGYVTQDARVGVEWRRHHVGFLFNYMNTAGKNGVTDYSGSCDYKLRNKGYKARCFLPLLSGEGKSQYLYIRAVCGALDRFCAEQGERDKPPVRRVRPGSWIPEG